MPKTVQRQKTMSQAYCTGKLSRSQPTETCSFKRWLPDRTTLLLMLDISTSHSSKPPSHTIITVDSRDRAVILLVGFPQLNSPLRPGVHEPLRQRIIMNYNMEGLSKEEGRTYISETLKGAGGTPDIFDGNTMEAVINADAVMQAVSDCGLG